VFLSQQVNHIGLAKVPKRLPYSALVREHGALWGQCSQIRGGYPIFVVGYETIFASKSPRFYAKAVGVGVLMCHRTVMVIAGFREIGQTDRAA